MNIGDKIDHERYGIGIISEKNIASFKAIFKTGGEREFSVNNAEYEIIESVDVSNEKSLGNIDIQAFEEILTLVLDKYNCLESNVKLGDKWINGSLELIPGKEGIQSKTIPIETFFHKIVMLRDRLRVLEQNINSHSKLDDEDKVNLQQYITKCYGSLTSFNILFDDKTNHFIGESKKKN